ncbi:hypothetical protein ACFQVC_42275 [Streptomyces monticola]|uniref:Uncharacterized protein n=1 Tax=Streptomyces monticola TaxID=2666263 RepID=A0ABW2JXW8_9ACTN
MLLLAIVAVALFGLGFVNSLWWVAGAVLVFGYFHYARRGPDRRPRRGDDSAYGEYGKRGEYGEYRDSRDREDRWARRYRHQRRGRWLRQDRRDRQHHH